MAAVAFKRFAIAVALVVAVGGALLLWGVTRYSIDDNFSLARVQLEKISASIHQFHADVGAFPANLDVLTMPGPPKALGPYLKQRELRDPWGQTLYYQPGKDGQSFALFSLGSDGRLGGTGPAEDIAVYFPEDPSAP